MKKLFNASGLLFVVFFVACADFSVDTSNPEKENATRATENPEGKDYYWSGGRKIYLDTDYTKMIVGFDSEEVLRTFTANISKENPFVGEAVALFDVRDAGVERKIVATKAVKNKIFASAYSGYVDAPFYMTGDIVMQPKEGVSVEDILAKHEVDAEAVNKTDIGVIVRLKDWSKLLSTANAIYESEMVDWCHPDFISMHEKMNPDDQYFSQQYYLKNMGQTGGRSGVDIHADVAWRIAKGNGIRVAVVDDGVEPHDDLARRVLDGFTPKNPNGNYYNGGKGRPTSAGAHGQACAGIIAASHNSGSNSYIAGVAPNVEIIPINIFYGGESVYDDAAAIEYAWNPNKGNADVISNSWSYKNGPPSNADVFEQQINNAVSQGRLRNGVRRGCVVVFAAGNRSPYQDVVYPARLSNVIAVGAVDKYGTVCYYSCRGSALDVVAPSSPDMYYGPGSGDVYTLDRMGSNGYETGNYAPYFGGTSAACPQVAGIAALILSVNPDMTSQQVMDNIKVSANGFNWNSTTGYGVANAYTSVTNAVTDNVSIIGPENPLYNTNTVYKLNSLTSVTGVSVNWSVLPSGSATISGSGNSRTIKFLVSGANCTVQARITTPSGKAITVSKVVSIKPHQPMISHSGNNGMHSTNLYPGGVLIYNVTNSHPDATYDWDIIQGDLSWNVGSQICLTCPTTGYGGAYSSYIIVRCRSLIGGVYSDWSQHSYVMLMYLLGL